MSAESDGPKGLFERFLYAVVAPLFYFALAAGTGMHPFNIPIVMIALGFMAYGINMQLFEWLLRVYFLAYLCFVVWLMYTLICV